MRTLLTILLSDDIASDKLQLARDVGAEQTFNSMNVDDADIVRSDTTIVASGSKAAYAFALKTVKTHARIITLGVPTEPVPITGKSLLEPLASPPRKRTLH